jgi:hypothetical protein
MVPIADATTTRMRRKTPVLMEESDRRTLFKMLLLAIYPLLAKTLDRFGEQLADQRYEIDKCCDPVSFSSLRLRCRRTRGRYRAFTVKNRAPRVQISSSKDDPTACE